MIYNCKICNKRLAKPNARYCKKHRIITNETRAKMSASGKQKVFSDKHKKAISISKIKANPGYRALHYWVEKQLGKPQGCESCCTTTARRYHWANVSRKYLRTIKDWKRLCVKCHKAFDGEYSKSRKGII